MRGFEANNCRLCEKAFCCEKCRRKHETNFHKVIPDCNICIYGQFVFEDIEDTYLQHVETSHLPLNCVYCKRIFGSIEDILQHKKCPVLQLKDDSPKKQATPGILISADDQDSPILLELQRKEALNYIFNLATSTPMQEGQEPNLVFGKIKDPITPVDNISQVINKSIIKKTDSLKSDHSSKRRVTFGETPGSSAANKSIVSEDKKIISNKDMECSGQKSSDTFLTPVTGRISEPFYSAKSEVERFRNTQSEVSSKITNENSSELPAPEGFTPGTSSVALKSESNDSAAKTDEQSSDAFSERSSTKESKLSTNFCTPVSTANVSKKITSEDNIYKPQELEVNSQLDGKSSNMEPSLDKNETMDSNLNEISMEICTPARNSVSSKSKSNAPPAKTDEESSNNNFSDENSTNESKLSINFCTPANPGKITVKGAMYKNSELSLNDQHASPANQEKSDVSTDKENKSESDSTNREPEVVDATGCKTLWLSAINLEDSEGAEQQNKENEMPNGKNKMPDDKKYSNEKTESPESPQKPTRRRVSIVMPTPVLKRTDVQMKFHIPAHFSSTPIISSGVVKMKQTRIVKEISARVLKPQTPFKTPQGKLSEFRQQSTKVDTFSDIGAGPSSTQNELVLLSQINENCETNPCREIRTYHSDIENHGISVSSMTESTLWTSMTRIVKSVLGFTNTSDRNMSVNSSSTSFKRQLSDPDSSGDFLEAPRLKRFKFTDIKCRRPIRNLPALEAPRKLPAISGPVTTTLEIVKSVSTLYGEPRMRIKCDKATQTDDYLMYGWHPKI